MRDPSSVNGNGNCNCNTFASSQDVSAWGMEPSLGGAACGAHGGATRSEHASRGAEAGFRHGWAQPTDEEEAKRPRELFFVEEQRYDSLGESAMWQGRGRLGEGVGRRALVFEAWKVKEKAEGEDRAERRRKDEASG